MDEAARSRTRVKGEVVPFGKLFAALTTLKRRDRVSELDVQVYEDRTAHIPLNLLSRAVTRWIDTQEWFPTVAELLQTCEAIRVEMRGAVKFKPCEKAEDDDTVCSMDGWTQVVIDGVKRQERCQCYRLHQRRVAELGVPAEVLALPPIPLQEIE